MQTASIAIVLFAILYLCLRFWPIDKDQWHVDPADTSEQRRFGVHLTGPDAPRLSGDAATVLDAVLEFAKKSDRISLLDGSVGEGMITFLVRSPMLGYRDYVTFKAVTQDDVSKLAIHARPGMNVYDWGSNAKLLDEWLAQTQQSLGR